MNRFYSLTSTLVLLLFLSTGQITAQDATFRPDVMDEFLAERILENENQYLQAYILLKDQVDIMTMRQEFSILRASKDLRGKRVVKALKEKASLTQGALLEELRQSADVQSNSIRPFWITNMILVEAKGAYLAKLSQRRDILRIEAKQKVELTKHEAALPAEDFFEPNGREPGLTAINAHKLWELGYTGYGTKVMIIDSDIDFDHRALATQFFYHNAPFEQTFTAEYGGQICFSHGTNIAGVILGVDRLLSDTIGVAFNTKYINGPVEFFDPTGTQCELEGSTLGPIENLQFALDPDGNSNTSGDIPDVINNSWGTYPFALNSCNGTIYRNVFSALDAAGVSVVFAAGNDGPTEKTMSLQASLNFDEYVPFVVGSVDERNVISDFSSRGPSLCIDGPNTIKPEVVAPGDFIRTAEPFNRYEFWPGTSVSAPYVSGALLLLKEAFPGLTGRELNEALFVTAKDLGEAGEDNVYGNGLIDVFAAYNWLIEQGNTPTPALKSDNDIIVGALNTRLLDCARMIQAFMTVSNNGTEPVNSLDITFRIPDRNLALGTVTWTGEIQPGETKDIILDPMNAVVGTYDIQVNVGRVNGRLDVRSLDNVYKAEVNVIEDPVLPEVSIAGQEICKDGQSMIIAETDRDGTIRWYNELTGGNALAEGNTLLLQNLQNDTTLYVSVSTQENLGLANPDVGPNTFLSQQAGLMFDVFSGFTLKSVKVFAETAGPRVFQLKDDRGNVRQKLVALNAAGEHTVELDFQVEPGSDYELLMTVGSGLAITTNETGFPHTVDGILQINRSTGTVASFYAYFYDWQIEYDYVCGRVAVPISVDENGQAPTIQFEADKESVALNENGEAIVQFTNLTEGLVAYEWSFGDGYTSISPNPSNIYTEPGTYSVTLYGTNAEGCSSMAIKTIEVLGTATRTTAQRELEEQIRLFPNPAQSYLNLDVQLEQAKEVSYRLIDMLGRTHLQAQLGRESQLQRQIDISTLPAGTYTLIISADGLRVGKRVVKF